MAYETYPKSAKHPSMSVGEQDAKEAWSSNSRVEYGNTTVKDTVYNGDTVKTKFCDTGRGMGVKQGGPAQVSASYPKKSHDKFGSEKHVGK